MEGKRTLGRRDQEPPKTPTNQPISIESIIFLCHLKKRSNVPKNSGPSAPQNKRSRNIPGDPSSPKKTRFQKKILQTKSIKQCQETYSKLRSFKKKTIRSFGKKILWSYPLLTDPLEKTIYPSKKKIRSPKFPLDFLQILSPGPGAFYITVGRAISPSSDAAETVLRRRLVPAEGGRLWCFDIRGARHEERKDVFRWKTKQTPRKLWAFFCLEVEEWLCLVAFLLLFGFENVELC